MKKLPVIGPRAPSAPSELSAKPVRAGSRPEFPTREQAYRGAGILLAAGLAGGVPVASAAPPPVTRVAAAEPGTIDGQPITAARPRFKVWREGGGIGPSEDMWSPQEVQLFIRWTLAREGGLAIQSSYSIVLDGTTITLGGFDPAKNVGFVYTDQLNPAMDDGDRAKLDAAIKANKLAILFLDIRRAPDPATIAGKVIKFAAATLQAPPATAPLPVPPPPAAKPKSK